MEPNLEKAAYAVFGGLFAIFIKWLLDLIGEQISRRRKGCYLAARAVSILDSFTLQCVDVAGDDGRALGQYHPEHGAVAQYPSPELSFDQLDVSWDSIDPNLMFQLISFPNQIIVAERNITFAFENYSVPPEHFDGFGERQKSYAGLGLKSAVLAKTLREKYSLQSVGCVDESVVKYLEDRVQKLS